MPEEIKWRGRQMCRHLERGATPEIMEDDIYVFVLCWKWALPVRVSSLWECGGESFFSFSFLSFFYFCCRRCGWIKFSNLWHQQLFQMSQYLHGNNSVPPKTTFGDEANTFYQHVDRSPGKWLWGPHKGSQAKLQYFPKQPLGFLVPGIIFMLIRSLICILMLFTCSV